MAASNFDRKKKKLPHHVDRVPRDGNGMNQSTKRHFEEVKQKMLAFVNEYHQEEINSKHSSPVPSLHRSPSPTFVDQKKFSKHHHHPPPPNFLSAQRHLPHLGLATPQLARRKGRS